MTKTQPTNDELFDELSLWYLISPSNIAKALEVTFSVCQLVKL